MATYPLDSLSLFKAESSRAAPMSKVTMGD